MFKPATLVYKFSHTGCPKYFHPYLQSYSCNYNTRRSQKVGSFLTVPKLQIQDCSAVLTFIPSLDVDLWRLTWLLHLRVCLLVAIKCYERIIRNRIQLVEHLLTNLLVVGSNLMAVTLCPYARHLTSNVHHGLKRLVPDLSSAWVSCRYSSYGPQLSHKWLKDHGSRVL